LTAKRLPFAQIDLRSLRSFIVVAEELHFSRAAERLGIAQPPLSQQIRRLEDKVGCPLFVRGTRNVQITEAGRSLLQSAYRIFEQLGYGLDTARRVGRGELGRLRVAFPTSLTLTILPSIIRRFRDMFPDVALELQEIPTTPQIEALHAGTIDIGFLREPVPVPNLVFETVFEERFVAVLPARHPLAKRRSLNLAAFGAEKFIFFPREIGPEFYDRTMALCKSLGFEPNIVTFASEWQTIAALVEAGMGVSVAPAGITRVHLDHVVYRPIGGADARTRVVIGRRADAGTPATMRFLEIAKQIGMEHRP
jgi:DNA-binding transcriptional LysR family regulator